MINWKGRDVSSGEGSRCEATRVDLKRERERQRERDVDGERDEESETWRDAERET